MELRGSRGVQGDGTDHTKTQTQIFTRFGLTWHQKVHFSTFDGKLELQCTRNGPQNTPFYPGSIQDTFIIYSSISHQHIFRKYCANKKYRESNIWKSKKPRFTNRCPELRCNHTNRLRQFWRVLLKCRGPLCFEISWRNLGFPCIFWKISGQQRQGIC